MKKAVFIIPYFGKLPQNFWVWEKTAAANAEYDFWLITDDMSVHAEYPNIKVTHTSFDSFVETVQKKFDFPIGLTTPRKLCDFKPAYGYIFEDEIQDYSYWGYCDVDMVFGNLDRMIPIDSGYKKIYTHGHMTLIHNSYEMNRLFQKPVEGYSAYVEILSDSKNHVFDEPSNGLSINLICREYGVETFVDYAIADVNPYSYLFRKTQYDYSCPLKSQRKVQLEKNGKRVILWRDGSMFSYILEDTGEVGSEEIRYLHHQKRNMKICIPKECTSFLIVPNKMIPFAGEVTENVIRKYTKGKRIYPQYYKLKWNNLKKKIGERVYAGAKR